MAIELKEMEMMVKGLMTEVEELRNDVADFADVIYEQELANRASLEFLARTDALESSNRTKTVVIVGLLAVTAGLIWRDKEKLAEEAKSLFVKVVDFIKDKPEGDTDAKSDNE